MASEFDLVVIGTGSAGGTVASLCRTAGWRVAIVDSRPLGGTCALRGCDPKKVLVGAAEVIDWVRRMKGRGIVADGARIDWPELMRFKRSFTEPVPGQREKSFSSAGIATFHGRARFADQNSVRVGDEVLKARHVVIATGAKPAKLNIPGEEALTTSEQFLDLERLPASIAFVGGGYIAFEFAHLAARAGAKVTILHRGNRPLERFDPDLVQVLAGRTRALGIDVQLKTAVDGVHGAPGRLTVDTSGDSGRRSFDAEMVVHAAGRVPDIEDLDLSAAGVESSHRGVATNEFLQSVSNPAVYAAGDAAESGPPLTPVAGYDGRLIAKNLLEGNRHKADYTGVASVVFTIPPLAAVGLSEETARKQNRQFTVHYERTAGWYSSRRVAEECSGFKVLVEEGTGRILGAHILGERSEELINVFALAIKAGVKAEDLKQVLYSYPTHGSNIQYMV